MATTIHRLVYIYCKVTESCICFISTIQGLISWSVDPVPNTRYIDPYSTVLIRQHLLICLGNATFVLKLGVYLYRTISRSDALYCISLHQGILMAIRTKPSAEAKYYIVSPSTNISLSSTLHYLATCDLRRRTK
jgi:hypothetical protein